MRFWQVLVVCGCLVCWVGGVSLNDNLSNRVASGSVEDVSVMVDTATGPAVEYFMADIPEPGVLGMLMFVLVTLAPRRCRR
ncbi:MAG: PEP-CTERM sorting domain-containing protein [Planctomycetota bacterium]